MRKKTLIYLSVAIMFMVVIVLVDFTYYKNRYSFKNIGIKDVKTVTIYPFQGANPTKRPYSYDLTSLDDMKIVNSIINFLNTGKILGIEKGMIILQGGTPEHLVIDLTDGRKIDISAINGLLVSQSSTNKIYKFNSQQLEKLFASEIQRIFNK